MKSKVFGFKILFVMLAILTAGLCFGVGVKPTNQKSVAVAQSTKTVLGEDKEEFSALFDGNVIFSAEKVLVAKDEKTQLGSKSFYYGTFVDNSRQTEEYKFNDIQTSASGKTDFTPSNALSKSCAVLHFGLGEPLTAKNFIYLPSAFISSQSSTAFLAAFSIEVSNGMPASSKSLWPSSSLVPVNLITI